MIDIRPFPQMAAHLTHNRAIRPACQVLQTGRRHSHFEKIFVGTIRVTDFPGKVPQAGMLASGQERT
jgi:hypothetical protein